MFCTNFSLSRLMSGLNTPKQIFANTRNPRRWNYPHTIVRTANQLAGMFMRALPRIQVQIMSNKLGIIDIYPPI